MVSGVKVLSELLSMSAHSLPQQEGAGSLPEADVQAYSVRDFSRIYAVSESTTRRLIKENTIDNVLVGGRRLIVAASARTWFQSLLSEQGVAA